MAFRIASESKIVFPLGMPAKRLVQFSRNLGRNPSNQKGVVEYVSSGHDAITVEVLSEGDEMRVEVAFDPSKWRSHAGTTHLSFAVRPEDGGGKLLIPVHLVND